MSDILICDFQAHSMGYWGLDLKIQLCQRFGPNTFRHFTLSMNDFRLYLCNSEQNIFWIWRNFEYLKYLANGENGNYNNDNGNDECNGEDNDRKNST